MFKELRASLTLFLTLALLTGLAYPIAILGLGQMLFPVEANGSLIMDNGKIIGSSLIGQNFTSTAYFHPRPSYAGNGYDAANSSGSNLAPTSADLTKSVSARIAALKAENGNPNIPVDFVTSSGSGLDPDISPAAAHLQAARIALARHIDVVRVNGLIDQNTQSRTFGILGENRVNVLQLNRALDQLAPLQPQALHGRNE